MKQDIKGERLRGLDFIHCKPIAKKKKKKTLHNSAAHCIYILSLICFSTLTRLKCMFELFLLNVT